MWHSPILGRPIGAATSTSRSRPVVSRPRKFCPVLEALEDRLTPSTQFIDVTSLADSNTDGSGALRAAITKANTGGFEHNTIDIRKPGTYRLTLNGADEDANATGDLDILKNVFIQNSSGGVVVIDAAGLTPRDRVFDIAPDGADIIVTLTGVTIQGGEALAGGGIRVPSPSDLTLGNVILQNNNAGIGGGAGIFLADGDLFLRDTTVRNNISAGTGGGIFQLGNGGLNITASVMDHNQSQSTSTLVGGGGVRYDGTGDVSIFLSQFSNNFAAGNGGGFANTHNARLAISSSTFESNRSNGNGGGLFLSTEIPSTLTNVTISNNVASIGGGLAAASATGGVITLLNDTIVLNAASNVGGVFANGPSLRLINTIVAQNVAGVGGGPDVVAGSIVDVANNFIGDNSSPANNFTAGTPNAQGSFVGTAAAPLDPLLGPLALNGTNLHAFTHANLANNGNNGVRDRGLDADAPTTDERGFPRVAGAHADIGAFEFQNPDLAVSASGPAGTTLAGQPLPLTFAVTNIGSIASNGVTLTVTLPPGTTVVTASGGFTVSGNVVTFAVPDLAAGAGTTLTLTVTPAAPGPFTATAALSADPNPANNLASVSVTVLPRPIVVLPQPFPTTGFADVTDLVRVLRLGRRPRKRLLFRITNVSGMPIQGPLGLVVAGLRRRSTRLLNASGISAGREEFVRLDVGDDNLFDPGESAVVRLVFAQPFNPRRLRLLAGAFA